ncbi:MAG: hypothetical protein IJX14_12710 [Clostridia bacterium]|nr:hypothetical protein [Clostridia bacterium]
MFENLGEKLMRAAKGTWLYGVSLSILIAIVCFFGDEPGIGLLFFVGGPVCCILLAVLLYWMGKVLVNQEEMIRRQREIAELLRGKAETDTQEKK